MITLLKCERLKSKKRYLFLTMFAITLVEMVWVLYKDYSPEILRDGWLAFLYQLPLINTMFIPVLAIVIASRLCDTEHKGQMFKELFCIAPRGQLYDAKLIFGLGIMMVSLILQFASIYIAGKVLGFGGAFPIRLYGIFWLFTIVPTVAVYIFQHTLSMIFKNQTIASVVGIIGVFLGMFSIFLSQYPWFRNSILWGWFGSLQFVGNNWSRETRINNFFVMDIEWSVFIFMILGSIAMYLIGRKLFCEREV